MDVPFVEVVIATEPKNGCTEELVCYAKRADLSETGVSEEELREFLVAEFDAFLTGVAKAIEEILPDDAHGGVEAPHAERETTKQTAKSMQKAKIESLLARGVFIEVRTICVKEVVVETRDVLRWGARNRDAASIDN